MTGEHLVPLRENGIADEGIHTAATIVGYFNLVNRIAQGLGVELEPE